MKRIPLVYIAGPYRAEHPYQIQQNINNAWNTGVEICKLGYYPVVPHLSTMHMEGLGTPEFFIEATLEVMRRCDAVLVCPNFEKSKGTLGEIKEANKLGIPVFYTILGLQEYFLKKELEKHRFEKPWKN